MRQFITRAHSSIMCVNSFRTAFSICLALFFLTALVAQAQPGISSRYHDEQAEPTGVRFTNVRHTGTDALMFEDHLVLQAMTWDDGNGAVYLSWALIDPNDNGSSYPVVRKDAYPPSGQIRVNRKGSDPDVVLARDPYNRDEIYANLVYVDGRQVQYEGYHWTPGGFDPTPDFSVAVGNPAYLHEYPNLDANDHGLVALTWQQSIEDDVTVNVASNNNYFPPYSFTQHVTFGRTYFALSDIRGHIQPCTKDNGVIGILTKNPPTGLFEQTLHPDISISEGNQDEAVVSNTFIRHYVDGNGLFSVVNKLAVRQYRYFCRGDRPGLDTLATHEWKYSYNNIIGTPRIAAPGSRTNQADDVEIVVDYALTDCGDYREYRIMNFSKFSGRFKAAATLLNPNYVRSESIEPVVSYYSDESQYVVSWMGTDYESDKGANGRDIWSLTMKSGGNFTSPGGGSSGALAPDAYSRVNNQVDGTQWSPSIAARHLRNSFMTTHLFADEQQQQVSFHFTDLQAGVTGSGLRSTREGNTATPATPTSTTGLLQTYPNPSEHATATTVQLRLRKGEQVLRVLVLDLTGRQVADLTPAMQQRSAPEQSLTWKPSEGVAGSYLIRAVTSQRSETTAITRK